MTEIRETYPAWISRVREMPELACIETEYLEGEPISASAEDTHGNPIAAWMSRGPVEVPDAAA